MSIAHLYKSTGALVSTANFTPQQKQDAEVFFHHSEKANVMLTACSSWYGGDFMEFGSHDLNTFRDFLTAYNICGMTQAYPDVQFWGFDIFGKLDKDIGDLKAYFEPYSKQGDRLQHHYDLIKQHGLYVDKCRLVQGLFADTLTQELKDAWRNDKVAGTDYSQTALHLAPEHRNSDKRHIGFASIDCNIGSAYKTVFEWIFDALAPNSYVYMDEGLQSPEVLAMWTKFMGALFVRRHMGAAYVRNAAGFGSLWRLYPLVDAEINL